MPALITHHIFGEDAYPSLPEEIVSGEEELLAYLLGNQGPDPFFMRFTGGPSANRVSRKLAHDLQSSRTTRAFLAARDAVSHLPEDDKRIGRAFVLGMVGHYVLDRTVHPFVYAQQAALIDADPTLGASASELHAVIESDIDTWLLWEKRHATVHERPADANLMRTERTGRVAGAIFSQVAFSVYALNLGAEQYAGAVGDYEFICRLADPAGSPHVRVAGAIERMVRGNSMAEALSHYVRRSRECPAANLEHGEWENPFTHKKSAESFPDLYELALADYPALAEAVARGNKDVLANLVAGLNYEGRPDCDD